MKAVRGLASGLIGTMGLAVLALPFPSICSGCMAIGAWYCWLYGC